jgi:hypothetical protein
MNLNNYLNSFLSKNKILSLLDERKIFENYYGQTIDLRKSKYLNPFRADKRTGSCHFNYHKGRLYFFDKAIDENYDLFSFICQKYNCNYYQSLYIINEDYNLKLKVDELRLGNFVYKKNNIKNNNYHKTNFERKSNIRTEFKVTTKDFSDKDVEYWNKYGITKEDLIFFNIKSVKQYYTNVYYYDWKLAYDFDTQYDSCFVYQCKSYKNYNTPNSKLYLKLYRPTSKQDKWRTNYSNDVVQNYNNLWLNDLSKPNTPIFICSSFKDGICLYKMGYNFIVPPSESSYLCSDLIKELKNKFKDQLYIFYDNDSAGIINSIKHSYLYQVPYLILEPIYNSDAKDVSDYVKNFGYNFTYNQIKRSLKSPIIK